MRASSTTRARSAPVSPTSPTPDAEQPARGQLAGLMGMSLARKLVAVLVVLGILAFPFVQSLRVYYSQQAQAAQARQEIASSQQQIGDLNDEVSRWKDPNYVKAQARSRLGWVVPGEIGYKVIGPDGKPLGGGVQLDGQSELPRGEHRQTWWEKVSGSVAAADKPAPAKSSATPSAAPRTIQPTPAPSTTPKR